MHRQPAITQRTAEFLERGLQSAATLLVREDLEQINRTGTLRALLRTEIRAPASSEYRQGLGY